MTLPAGARLGPYEVVAPLGAGGMGEVYRARDPRLGREVAIKVLLASFSSDPNRLRRSEQEARAASAEAEITRADFLPFEYDVWHDRAVFHFLTSAADRDAYVSSVLKAVKPGGHVIVCDVCGGWPGSLQRTAGHALQHR